MEIIIFLWLKSFLQKLRLHLGYRHMLLHLLQTLPIAKNKLTNRILNNSIPRTDFSVTPNERLQCIYFWQNLIWGSFRSQHARGVLRKRCSENMQQVYSSAPIKYDFNKVAVQIAPRHGCTTVNLLHIFGTALYITHLEGCFWLLFLLKSEKN